MNQLLQVTCLLAFIVVPCAAAERTHQVTPEDYFSLAQITELVVSPDGKHVAFCQGTWDKADDKRRTDLWVVAIDGKSPPQRLTFDRANDRHPKWSADGKSIYCLGNRQRAAETKPPFDNTVQVWRIDAAGGDPKAVTREAGGVTGFDYAAAGNALFFSKDADHSDDDDFAKLRAKHKADYGHGKRKISEIHRLNSTTWRVEKVYAEKRYVREFAVTSDGKRIAMVTAFDDSVVKSEGESRIDVLENGKVTTPPTEAYRAKASSPYAWLENLCWSPDGDKFAFTVVHDAHPAEIVIGVAGRSEWLLNRLVRKDIGGPWEVVGYGRAAGQPLEWLSADVLAGTAERMGESGLFMATAKSSDGSWSGAWNGKAGKSVLGSDRGGNSAAYLVGTPARFPVVAADLGDDAVLADPNPHVANWKMPTFQHITWKAPDGAEVGGVLELPHGYKKGDKLPLVVAIHGGPTTSTKANLIFDVHNGRLYFAAAGYAVLCPNYRGSTGYGDKFVTDLIGNENDIEVKDILAGIQHLIKEGLADPERVGVMGWSNGGYLTNCLIALKDSPVKFKAASSGAGILDTVAEWGFNDEPAYPMVFKKGLPWEQPEIYRKTSPIYGMGNVTTPTLIHVGGNDERCPPGHSRTLYRALHEYRKVPTELVVYPGEPHGLTKMSHLRAKMEWDLAWFEKYVKNAGK